MELFSSVFHLMSGPTLFITGFRTPYLWLSVLTSLSESRFSLLHPAPCLRRFWWVSCSRRLCSFCLPSLFLVFSYTWSLPPPLSASCFGLTPFRLTFPLLVSSESCWPGPEVLCLMFLVGKLADLHVDLFSLPANSKSSSLVIFPPIYSGLPGLRLCFSSSCLTLRLWCQVSHCRCVLCLVFRFQNHSSTFWFQ